ncbi:MAG: hypothetical protein H7320_08120 [Ferruginibacter sp.]|nr:hypothetical protein [Ferruginibacter sp.]
MKYLFLAALFLKSLTGHAQTTYTFSGNGNWSDSLNWINHVLPPEVLPAGSQIVIDPITSGICILDTTQIIASGAFFKVNSGKKISITGKLFQRGSNDSSGLFSFSSDTTNKYTGVDTSSMAVLKTIPIVQDDDTIFFRRLPATSRSLIELPIPSLELPVPGDQGKWQSCVGWAAGYAAFSFLQKQTENNSSYFGTDKKFSPVYLWNKINGGKNVNTTIPDALTQLRDFGCCKYVDMIPELNAPGATFSPIATANASNYKIAAFKRFENAEDMEKLKKWLNIGNPLIALIRIDEDFKLKVVVSFKKLADGRFVWVNKSGNIGENHAVLICGYDDEIQAFKIMNSWGTGWLNSGFVWIDYKLFSRVVLPYPYINTPEIFMLYPRLPKVTVTTIAPTNLTPTGAHLSGSVVVADASKIIETGICYSIDPDPTTGSTLSTTTSVSAGTAAGNFSVDVTELTTGLSYNYRAYARTDQGIVYGHNMEVTPMNATIPVLTTIPVTGLTQTDAISGGNILNEVGAPVTSRGLAWSIYPNVTQASLADYKIANTAGTGQYTVNLTNLLASPNYYVRAFATNSIGTGYGNEITLPSKADDVFTDGRDGQAYTHRKIGTQVWMTQNFNYEPASGSVCYDNSTTNCNKYGRMYRWDAAVAAAPPGWHLPSDADWTTLTNYLASNVFLSFNNLGSNVIGDALKDKSAVNWWINNNVANLSGFNGLPGGQAFFSGGAISYSTIGTIGDWWTSTLATTGYAYNRSLKSSNAVVGRAFQPTNFFLSVRYVKD